MRLAIDAMGGDQAPQAMVQGALDYTAQHPDHQVILVGQTPVIEAALASEGAAANDRILIEHADQVITMAEKISALRDKPDDSMNRCARMVKDGSADAMVLCGNTACSVAAAQLHLRRIKGVRRAGIITPLPTIDPQRHTWVIDTGANAVGKAEHLTQFAEMASTLLHHYLGIDRPSVGILSIGAEEGKGDDLIAKTAKQLAATDVNLVGNVEGNDIYQGIVDIVVCDGFTGNVLLKTSEGLASTLGAIIRQETMRQLRTKLGGLMMKPAFERVRQRTHWSLVGGCLLLGVGGITVIGHGRSSRVAVFHALCQAARCVSSSVMLHLRQHMAASRAS